MTLLILGLFIFLGTHSVRMLAPAWRERQIERYGESSWKGVYALSSLLGFALIVYGFAQARLAPIIVWTPPLWARHVALPLMLLAFICFAAAYIPGNWLKARFGHPLLAGVKTWSFAHLLANGTLAHIVLFGSFLLWSVLLYRHCRQRDKAQGTSYAPRTLSRDLAMFIVGTLAAVGFATLIHPWLIGVRPY